MEREVLLSTRVHPRFISCCVILSCPEAAEWTRRIQVPVSTCPAAAQSSVSVPLSEPQIWKDNMFTHMFFPGMVEFGSAHVWVSSALLVSSKQTLDL